MDLSVIKAPNTMKRTLTAVTVRGRKTSPANLRSGSCCAGPKRNKLKAARKMTRPRKIIAFSMSVSSRRRCVVLLRGGRIPVGNQKGDDTRNNGNDSHPSDHLDDNIEPED